MRKTHSMFYAYLQCSVASVLPRGMGLSPGFYFIFYFFGSLEREPSLWENTWPWEILRTWENFPGIRLGNQDLWGGEKESTFDTGRRVETGTYHWEGRKPFVQTFEELSLSLSVIHVFCQSLLTFLGKDWTRLGSSWFRTTLHLVTQVTPHSPNSWSSFFMPSLMYPLVNQDHCMENHDVHLI